VQPFLIPSSEQTFKGRSSQRPSAQRRYQGKENRNQPERSGSSRGRGRPLSNTNIHQTDTEAEGDMMTVENEVKP